MINILICIFAVSALVCLGFAWWLIEEEKKNLINHHETEISRLKKYRNEYFRMFDLNVRLEQEVYKYKRPRDPITGRWL